MAASQQNFSRTPATPDDEFMSSPGPYTKTVADLGRLTAPRSSPEAASPTAVSATRPDTPAPPGTRRRSHNDSCAHRLVFDDLNVNGGQWRDEDVLASGLSRVAVEPAPKRRRRREPAVRFTAPLSERQAVQGQYDEQNRRP